MTAFAATDPLPPDPPRDFSLRLGDIVRVETADPRIPFVGRIERRLCDGRLMVETAARARCVVRAEACRIVLTREAAAYDGVGG